MKTEVFTALLGMNQSLDQAIEGIKKLEGLEGLTPESINLFVSDAERLRAGVNRYAAEAIRKQSDDEAAKLDGLAPGETLTTQ